MMCVLQVIITETARKANSLQLSEEKKKSPEGCVWRRSKLLVGLTQILPVSIPTDSLLVSGLKDIQELGAEDTKTYKKNSFKLKFKPLFNTQLSFYSKPKLNIIILHKNFKRGEEEKPELLCRAKLG